MQETSSLYKEILAEEHHFETRLAVGGAVSPTVSLSAAQPVFVVQPSNCTVNVGDSAVFKVKVIGGCVYQWQYRVSSSAGWYNSTLASAKSVVLVVPAIASRNGYQYRCRAIPTGGKVADAVYSSYATLTVSSGQRSVTNNNSSETETAIPMEEIWSLESHNRMFSGNSPSFGGVVIGELDAELILHGEMLPRRARMTAYTRAVSDEDGRFSEWIEKGTYYINTREEIKEAEEEEEVDFDRHSFHCYNILAKSRLEYTESKLSWPATASSIAAEIAKMLGVNLDGRTAELLQMDSVNFNSPIGGFTIMDMLGYIATPFCGNWIMSDIDELRLSSVLEIPADSRLLIDENGNALVFGDGDNEVRILI